MRILHLLGDRRLPRQPDTTGSSGVVRAALELAAAQVQRGHDVTILAVGAEAWETRWRGVRLAVRRAVSWGQVRVAGRSIDFRTHLANLLYCLKLRPDVVHAHNYYYLRGLPVGRRVIHFHADPLYVSTRGVRTDFSPADFALVARTSHVQVGNSHFVTAQVRRGLGAAGNVHTVYCGVEYGRYGGSQVAEQAAQLRASWGVRRDEPVLLYAGAVVPEKGVLHLARAYERLGTGAARLVLAGGRDLWGGRVHREDDGGYDQTVYAALADGIASGAVRALGNVPSREMPAVYAAADILVVPSVWHEAFGLVALEAAASSRPVIASATGGLPEIVTPACGITVPPGDEDALLAAMRTLIADPELRRRLGEGGRQHAAQFSWAASAAQLDLLYGRTPARDTATPDHPDLARGTA
ncbi:MAG: glycosyltransferase family 4 protein [Chloroflexi bacterium]|nr:glycosyltransferase family 4 protein [Chloroflexota bacterium]